MKKWHLKPSLSIQISIAKRSVLTRNTLSLVVNVKESDRDAFNISTTPDALNISMAILLLEKWNSKMGEMRGFTFPALLRFYFERWTWCSPSLLLLFSQMLYSMNTHTLAQKHTQDYILRELDPDEEACSLSFSQFFDTMEKKNYCQPTVEKKNKKNNQNICVTFIAF